MTTRIAAVLRVDRRANGRSTVDVQCPFCDTATQARLWSLSGSGKRCECGAVFRRNNSTGLVLADYSKERKG